MSHELEERLAHLIRELDDLSAVVARQDREIDRLARLVTMLAEREALREAERDTGRTAPEADRRPPHW